jgi:hypothetical protein
MERTSLTIRATVQQIRAAACIHSFPYFLFGNVYHVQILFLSCIVVPEKGWAREECKECTVHGRR